ncbi:MAG: hypothetical protein A2X49_11645 [Lentisphaerae bacterium GWF2_52_8]|nr:MAG: hypothetical protein A2X49_11645 [Lentisphaerae bacterium GWF2_52_8]
MPPGETFEPYSMRPDWEQVEIITSGFGVYLVDGREVKASPGSSFWFGDGTSIEAIADREEPYSFLCICFSSSKHYHPGETLRFEWENLESCRDFCRQAEAAYRQNLMPKELLCQYFYSRLLWEAECWRYRKLVSPCQPDALQLTIKYLERHYRKPVNLEHLASVAGISVSLLHNLFRRYLNTSPFAYVQNLRMNQARHLLANTRTPIKELVEQVGISDLKNFYTYFKRNTGMTPKEFRMQMRKGA